jgi:hypothetical protein
MADLNSKLQESVVEEKDQISRCEQPDQQGGLP